MLVNEYENCVIKVTGYKGGCFIGFFYLPEKNCQQKNGIVMNVIAIQYKDVLLKKHTLKLVVWLISEGCRNWSGQSGHGLISFSWQLKSSYNELKIAICTFVSIFILVTFFLKAFSHLMRIEYSFL